MRYIFKIKLLSGSRTLVGLTLGNVVGAKVGVLVGLRVGSCRWTPHSACDLLSEPKELAESCISWYLHSWDAQ
jgi:hypothetical protein